MELKFEEPTPRRTRGKHDHAGIAAALKARPGEWAVAFSGETVSTAQAVREGRLAAYRPAGAFEATCRGTNQAGRAEKIYVRYVGESREWA